MEASDKRHFWEMLQGLSVAQKSGDVTTGMLKVYWMCLQDMPVAAFNKAVEKAAQTCQWFPSVAELREMGGCKKVGVVPLYMRPVEDELERIETCSYHVGQGGATAAPSYVPWCRKCKRLALRGQRGGPPKALGELLASYGQLEAKK